MIFPLYELSPRREDNRTIAVAVSASIVVHMLVLLWQNAPFALRPSPDMDKLGVVPGPLVVQIVPPRSARPPSPRPAPPSAHPPAPRPVPSQPRAEHRPSPPPRVREPRVARRPPAPQPPPVIALDKPTPQAPATPVPRAEPSPSRTPAEQDLSSYIEQQRRARADASPSLAFPDARPQPQPPGEDANARANRLAAANLGTGKPQQAFGYDPRRGGGIFSVRHVAYDYAEFMFYGWNKEAKRNTAQLVEVRKGDAPDIRIAVVRRMIAIIREHEQGEFMWESFRLGRYVTLSARPRDNAALEQFMMEEFFDEMQRVR